MERFSILFMDGNYYVMEFIIFTWFLHRNLTYERFMRILSREMVKGTWMLSLGASAGDMNG